MKKKISMILVLCICFCLAACGAAASGKAAAPTPAPVATEAPAAAETPAAPAVPVPTATEAPSNQAELQSLVDFLNEEEDAHHTADDPSVATFELGKEPNTIVYKLSMQYFRSVIMVAETGDPEYVSAYNRTVECLPPMEVSLETTLRESIPELNVVVYMMEDEHSSTVIAVVDDGEILYDSVNGVGTAPTDVTPIIPLQELTDEEKAQLEEMITNSSVG